MEQANVCPAGGNQFDAAMERFLNAMTTMEKITLPAVRDAIREICELLRVSRAVTCYYDSLKYEQENRGEELVGYDNGKGGRIVAKKRLVTIVLTVVTCSVYMADDEPDWTPAEQHHAELVMSLVQTFIMRARLQSVVARLTFLDDDGYPNVRSYLRYMQHEGTAGRLRNTAAVHFNLKHFSLVNQQVGRRAGDFVMRSFFNGLSRIIGVEEGRGILCRQGGDNFASFIPLDVLDRALAYLKGTAVTYDLAHGEERVLVSATVGVLRLGDDFEYHSPADIMDKVMPSVQAARSSTVTDVVFYDDRMIANKDQIMRIQSLFPKAMANEEFRVYYQPKVSVNGGRLAGAEALCRWFHNGEMILPADFIPILEQGMEICRLDFYMLDHVCRDIRRWLDEGRQVVRISVNLSRKHMMDYDLLTHILEIVDGNNVPHEYIEFELTETTTDVEFLDLKRVVSGLQQAGISTSVDDFGIGYSSLNLLKEIPWNVLKVDRSFLPGDDDGPDSRRSVMFKHLVSMANELGLECITEGVESAAQVELLRENHCELAQGYYFDRPLPVEVFEQKLEMIH